MSIMDYIIKAGIGAAAGNMGSGFSTGNQFFDNPIVRGALSNALVGAFSDDKQNIGQDLLTGGIGAALGQNFNFFNNPQQSKQQTLRDQVVSQLSGRRMGGGGAGATKSAMQQAQQSTQGSGDSGIEPPTKPKIERTFGAELLGGLGMDEDNILYRLANTKEGMGILAGLAGYAADKMFSEKEDTRSSWERNPYAGGKNYGQMGGIKYNQGGIAAYPRRDGGIDPNEGSGTRDDVPALLTAGEFVMTRDAVQGAGGGDVRQGIDRMYNMMDKFERMA